MVAKHAPSLYILLVAYRGQLSATLEPLYHPRTLEPFIPSSISLRCGINL